MKQGKIISIEDRIPKLKQHRRKKANKRLATLLILFFSLIACIVYFQSPLSHVNSVTFKGNKSYSDEELLQVSGLNKKPNVWKVNEEAVEAKLNTLPKIKSTNIEIKFPNSVSVNVTEFKRIAFLVNEKNYFAVLENGTVLNEKSMQDFSSSAPLLFGFQEGDILKEMIDSLEALPVEVLNSISEIHYSPAKTDAYRIALFMNDGFEVNASIRSFKEKMAHYPSIVSQLDPNVKGIIDLEVGSYFKAYEQVQQEGAEDIEENEDER